MKLLTVAALSLIATTGVASAEGWVHNNAGMGQYEGAIDTAEGASLSYSCSGLGTTLSMSANGMHVAKGVGTLAVDGNVVADGNVIYSSKFDRTAQEMNVKADYGASSKEALNAVIQALQGGAEAVWTTPNGDTFTFDLTGSAKIKSCILY